MDEASLHLAGVFGLERGSTGDAAPHASSERLVTRARRSLEPAVFALAKPSSQESVAIAAHIQQALDRVSRGLEQVRAPAGRVS